MAESRELLAVREIAHAFLVAERPSDIQQFALDRVTPILGASFSLVMELSADGELLRPVAQHEWPAAHRHWIGALRVRVGDGPSGVAVAERRLVEVEDLFADPGLADWHEVAQELGFRSMLVAPLETGDGAIGAVAFYFADATCITPEQRSLVRAVADQLAAATDKARRTDALRRANAALAEANAELASQARAWARAEQQRAAVESRVVQAMLALTATDGEPANSASTAAAAADRLRAAHALAAASREFTEITRAGFAPPLDDVDPREPMRVAVTRWRHRAPVLVVQVEEPTVLLPTIQVSETWLARAVELAIGLAVATAVPSSVIRVGVELGRGFLSLHVRWTSRVATSGPGPTDIFDGVGLTPGATVATGGGPAVTAVDLALLQAITDMLRGDLRIEPPLSADEGSAAVVLLFSATSPS